MNPEESAIRQRYWQRQAAMVRRRVNLAWWIETTSGPLLLGSLAGAAALLLVRREMPQLAMWQTAGFTAAGLLLVGLVCLMIARRRFETTAESLVRINPHFPALRTGPTAVSGAPTKSKFLADLSWVRHQRFWHRKTLSI